MRRPVSTVVLAVVLSALAAPAAVGCSHAGGSGGMSSDGGGMMGGGSGSSSFSSTGERIFLTGVGSDGLAIPHTASRVARASLMMGGGGCAACHGADGRGGTLRMMSGTAVEAPDVTYAALISGGFTDATIGRAIRDGLDESGKPLNAAMPRWQMSAADVSATISYLKELAAR